MRRITLAAAMVATILASFPLAASATTECFEVSFSEEYRPESNEEAQGLIGVPQHQVTVDVPASMQGLVATISSRAENGDSVHINNYALIESASTVTITGTEDTANGVTQSSGTLTLGETTSAYYVMGPRALGEQVVGISVTLVATICAEVPDQTTSTTAPPVTTTVPPDTTTSTIPNAPTVSVDCETDMITVDGLYPGEWRLFVDERLVASFGVDDGRANQPLSYPFPGGTSVTLVAPDGTAITVEVDCDIPTTSTIPPVTVPPDTGSTLPFTGPFAGFDPGATAAGGAMSILAGLALLWALRRGRLA